MVSKIIAMVAAEPSTQALLDELLTGVGPEFHVQPATKTLVPGEQCSFFSLCTHFAEEGIILVSRDSIDMHAGYGLALAHMVRTCTYVLADWLHSGQR